MLDAREKWGFIVVFQALVALLIVSASLLQIAECEIEVLKRRVHWTCTLCSMLLLVHVIETGIAQRGDWWARVVLWHVIQCILLLQTVWLVQAWSKAARWTRRKGSREWFSLGCRLACAAICVTHVLSLLLTACFDRESFSAVADTSAAVILSVFGAYGLWCLSRVYRELMVLIEIRKSRSTAYSGSGLGSRAANRRDMGQLKRYTSAMSRIRNVLIVCGFAILLFLAMIAVVLARTLSDTRIKASHVSQHAHHELAVDLVLRPIAYAALITALLVYAWVDVYTISYPHDDGDALAEKLLDQEYRQWRDFTLQSASDGNDSHSEETETRSRLVTISGVSNNEPSLSDAGVAADIQETDTKTHNVTVSDRASERKGKQPKVLIGAEQTPFAQAHATRPRSARRRQGIDDTEKLLVAEENRSDSIGA